MLLEKYFKTSSLLLFSISLFGCAGLQDTVVQTKYINQNIQLQSRPSPVNLLDVTFYAVSEKNLDEFLRKIEEKDGDIVFFAISVAGYENLSLNVAELRRYIEQQKSLIVYYEENIEESNKKTREDEEEVVQTGSITRLKETLSIE